MNRKLGVLAGVAFLLGVGLVLFALARPDLRHLSSENLKLQKINSVEFPWSLFPGKITQVKSYQESYNLDSNDWIAGFLLDPAEAKTLDGWLFPVPSTGLDYGCAVKIADWLEEKDICDAGKMQAKRFKGYLYNSSHCEEGCDQTVILWVHEETGQSYIVGGPRRG